MKRISTVIIISIFCCVAIGIIIMEVMSLTMSGNEITSEAEQSMQRLSGEYANEMDTKLTEYETVIESIGNYTSAKYDMSRLDDGEYAREFLDNLQDYVHQFILNDESILGLYLYMNPDEMKEMQNLWFSGGELANEDPQEGYELYINKDEGYEWYYSAVEAKEPTWLDPYLDTMINKNVMSYVYPIFVGDKLCAVAGLDIEFTDFEAMVNEVKLYDSGYAFLINEGGSFISHTEYDIEDSIETVGYTGLSAALSEEKGIVKDKVGGSDYYLAFAKLDNGFTFVSAAKEQEVLDGLRRIELYSIILGVVIVLGTAFVSYIIGKSISNPIAKTAGDLELMQDSNFTGKGHQRYLNKRSEIGILAKAMGAIQSAMGNTVHTIRHSSDSVHSISDKINTLASTLTDEVTSISGVSEQLAASMEETAATADDLSSTAEKMTDYVDEMTGKNKECIQEVSEIGARAVVLKGEALSSSETAKQMTIKTSEKMRTAIEDSKQVAKIQELSQTILSIASQTSLLALNASIEAARAGEFGKGFAVVASEISQLAVSSEKSAQEIQEITNDVIGTVHELSETAGDMLEFVETNLTSTYEKLLDTSDQYSKDTEHITDVLTTLSRGMEDLSVEIKNVARVFQDLKRSTYEGAAGTTDIAKNVEVISDDISVLQRGADELGSVSQQLISLINGFVIE